MLKISKLKAGYGNLQVLKGIDIEVGPKDLAIIIGPNGSGKSTAVKSVFGLTTRFSGKISFNGKDLTKMRTHKIVKEGIGYVPQGRLVFDSLTVSENLDMGGYDLTSELKEKRKQNVIELFPILKKRLNQKASFLSGGQQQMLSIARALMREPKLLLLDEPSLGLDPKTQKLIFKMIKEISLKGTAVMMVEQNAYHALKICTKAYVIESGAVVASGGPELAKKKRMKELYLGGM